MKFSRYEQNIERIMAIDIIIIHPKYNWMENLNRDIALLHVKQSIPFTDVIHPVCLPTRKVTKM